MHHRLNEQRGTALGAEPLTEPEHRDTRSQHMCAEKPPFEHIFWCIPAQQVLPSPFKKLHGDMHAFLVRSCGSIGKSELALRGVSSMNHKTTFNGVHVEYVQCYSIFSATSLVKRLIYSSATHR